MDGMQLKAIFKANKGLTMTVLPLYCTDSNTITEKHDRLRMCVCVCVSVPTDWILQPPYKVKHVKLHFNRVVPSSYF